MSAAAAAVRRPPGVYSYPRDPATDRSTVDDFESVGLAAVDPATGLVVLAPNALAQHLLGRQVGARPIASRVGRPARDTVKEFRPSTQPTNPPALVSNAPGSIRRNLVWPIVGGGGVGLFSSTANGHPGGPGLAFEVTGVAEYYLSTLRRLLPRALSWVVAGPKPPIAEGPDGQHAHRMGAWASGWPVVAPTVPSYSARVPLRRPQGLVSNT